MRFTLVLTAVLALLSVGAGLAFPEDAQTTEEFLSGERYKQHIKADEEMQIAGREAARTALAGGIEVWRPRHEEYLRRLARCEALTESLAIDVVTVPTDLAQHLEQVLEFARLISMASASAHEARLTATALGRAVDRLPEDRRAGVLAALAKMYVAPLGKK